MPSIKRSPSTSPSPSPPPPASTNPSTSKEQKSPKKPRTNTKTTSFPTSTSGSWTNERKTLFVNRLMETGYKNMDWKSLAEETQMTVEQCKNQMTPGRSNLRKTISEMFK
ncbi:uncharacterized protein I303_101079 [Kwoniella dejecticola CBS 10117]|uniref:Uncharacterized protein n=1 Tax=Kwoniella dejecticola CBS 10117 TaxID=1296121 RepID=A0AAJ8MDQ6_9TREE